MHNKGFIFDLDGVVVDTAGFHYLAWRNLARDLGFDFTEEQNENFKGVSRKRSLDLLLEIGERQATPKEKKGWLVSKNDEYLSYIENMTEDDILPGVSKVLNHLIERQVPMALGSASKNAKSILKRVGLLKKFHAIVDGNDVSKAKPNPEVFLIGAGLLNVEPKNCIVFEDSIAGIQAANIAHMTSIGIGNPEILHETKHNFNDFTEISLDFINQLIDN